MAGEDEAGGVNGRGDTVYLVSVMKDIRVDNNKPKRIIAAQHILASIFSSQNALRALAPEFNWSGLGNLLGDFGELVAIEDYQLQKAPTGASGYDAVTKDGQTVQIKTNFVANQIGFRGKADLLLVIGINTDASWKELYFGDFEKVKAISRYSSRDNKFMVAVSKLKGLVGE